MQCCANVKRSALPIGTFKYERNKIDHIHDPTPGLLATRKVIACVTIIFRYISYEAMLWIYVLDICLFQQVYSMAKKEALIRPGEMTNVVRETVLRKALPDPEERREAAPKRKLVDRVIQWTRKKLRPADPTDIHGELNLEWITNNAPGLELIRDINENDTRILIFSTEEQLQTLSTADLWLFDGTFRVWWEPELHVIMAKDITSKHHIL